MDCDEDDVHDHGGDEAEDDDADDDDDDGDDDVCDIMSSSYIEPQRQ